MATQRDKATGELDFPNLTPDMVKIWHENWHRYHPETRLWHEACHAFENENGFAYVPDLDYRRRFFPGGVSKKNAVPNMMIQGFAASIANRALLAINEEIPFKKWSPWSGLCLQVHDDIKVYAPIEKAEEAARVLQKCMPYSFNGVEFPIDKPSITDRWSAQA